MTEDLKLQGKTIQLNTKREGIFYDPLSGIKLDIFSKGTYVTVPEDLEDEKLENIKRALQFGILFLRENAPKVIIENDEKRKELRNILSMSVDAVRNRIYKINDQKLLDFLMQEEEASKARVSITKLIKQRKLTLAGGNITSRKEAKFQVKNIVEK